MKKIILLFFGLCFLISCTKKYESTVPKNVINKKQMEDLLVDVYMLEASTRTCITSNQSDSLDIWIAQQMNALLKKRNISYSQFIHNYSYYMGHEKLSQELMENVVNRLVKTETEAIIQVQKSRKQTKSDLKNLKSKTVSIKIKK